MQREIQRLLQKEQELEEYKEKTHYDMIGEISKNVWDIKDTISKLPGISNKGILYYYRISHYIYCNG